MKYILRLLLSLIPTLALGQTKDPGSPSPYASTKGKAVDSTHHTDTIQYHYAYSGTGTLNNNNSLRSFVLSNILKLSMAKKSSTVDFGNSWIYGRQNSVITNNDFSSSLSFTSGLA